MHVPLATYRLQFSPGFTFKQASQIVQYLSQLGISDIYASPVLKPKTGSAHGYDVVDPTRINPDLGTMEEFSELIADVHSHKMSWIQDIVPNHMAYDSENFMLMDILENGQRSKYIHVFDIEWEHRHESVRGQILAPFLGKFYEDALEDGEIRLKFDKQGFSINYYEHRLPLKIETYEQIITYRLNSLKTKLGKDHPDIIKFLGLVFILKGLSSDDEQSNWYDQVFFFKSILWELYEQSPEIKAFLDENIRLFNGAKGMPESFNLLDNLLHEQHYRLSFWKVATEEINYRRFFNINGLISLKMENNNVFEIKHGLMLDLYKKKYVQGFRIDHVDGLYDPTGYLQYLREKAPDAYVAVEKILEPEEDLPAFWPVQGTTGYDYLNYANGVFCQTKHEKEFDKIYAKFIGSRYDVVEMTYEKKRLIIGKHMAGDVERLAHQIEAISSRNRYGSDITLYGLKRALVELLAYFPVYRTYISNDFISKTDRDCMRDVIKFAREENPGLLHEFNFIERFLLPKFAEYFSEEQRKDAMDFVMRFQQLTGPLMAKGLEDTVFYIYNRLISINEVGGNPARFGYKLEEFHDFCQYQADLWPHTLNASATHDTKRGEDNRARINVLSEMPKEWDQKLKKWSKINSGVKKKRGRFKFPDKNDEYFLYQTLIGAFPSHTDYTEKTAGDFIARITEYVIKAVREAKVHTAWLKPDFEYEDFFIAFVKSILTPHASNEFLEDFIPFQKKISYYGIFNSLSQTLIKLTAPGIPDLYQGTEFWDLSLVDPDNRRPVDFAMRTKALKSLKDAEKKDHAALLKTLLKDIHHPQIKLFVIYKTLATRLAYQDVFNHASYIPLETTGEFKDHVVAFARKHNHSQITLTIVPRFLTHIIPENKLPLGMNVWKDTAIELHSDFDGEWKHTFTGESIKMSNNLLVGNVFKDFPLALLTAKEPQ